MMHQGLNTYNGTNYHSCFVIEEDSMDSRHGIFQYSLDGIDCMLCGQTGPQDMDSSNNRKQCYGILMQNIWIFLILPTNS
jgi:hypothetical protein